MGAPLFVPQAIRFSWLQSRARVSGSGRRSLGDSTLLRQASSPRSRAARLPLQRPTPSPGAEGADRTRLTIGRSLRPTRRAVLLSRSGSCRGRDVLNCSVRSARYPRFRVGHPGFGTNLSIYRLGVGRRDAEEEITMIDHLLWWMIAALVILLPIVRFPREARLLSELVIGWIAAVAVVWHWAVGHVMRRLFRRYKRPLSQTVAPLLNLPANGGVLALVGQRTRRRIRELLAPAAGIPLKRFMDGRGRLKKLRALRPEEREKYLKKRRQAWRRWYRKWHAQYRKEVLEPRWERAGLLPPSPKGGPPRKYPPRPDGTPGWRDAYNRRRREERAKNPRKRGRRPKKVMEEAV